MKQGCPYGVNLPSFSQQTSTFLPKSSLCSAPLRPGLECYASGHLEVICWPKSAMAFGFLALLLQQPSTLQEA